MNMLIGFFAILILLSLLGIGEESDLTDEDFDRKS